MTDFSNPTGFDRGDQLRLPDPRRVRIGRLDDQTARVVATRRRDDLDTDRRSRDDDVRNLDSCTAPFGDQRTHGPFVGERAEAARDVISGVARARGRHARSPSSVIRATGWTL